jgi:hypothetical protein
MIAAPKTFSPECAKLQTFTLEIAYISLYNLDKKNVILECKLATSGIKH